MPAWLLPALLGAGAGYGLSKMGRGSKARMVKEEVRDPYKEAVAGPLSSFLSQRIGKGLPRYTGALAPEIDPALESRYSEFLGLDSGEFFKEKIGDPATKRFREDVFPLITESFAGGLRGSGRFASELGALEHFQEGLAGVEADIALQLPQAQMSMGERMFALRDIEITRKIEDFYRSLPETNPVIQQALQFLGRGTSTGTTILAGLDPGQKGIGGDIIKAIISMAMLKLGMG